MLAGNPDQVGDGRVEIIDTPERAERLVRYLARTKSVVGLDCETVGCNPKEVAPARGVGSIVCWSMAVVLPGARLHSRTGLPLATRIFLWADALPWLEPWLSDPSCPKVGHNFTTFDMHMFWNHGIRVRGLVGDTLRLSKLKNPSSLVRHDLKSLMWWRLGYKLGSYEQLFSRPKNLGPQVLPELPVDRRGCLRVVRRKVGECPSVPTVWCPGEVVHRVSWAKTGVEQIPLDTVRVDYPRLVPVLMDYATLDAKATVELLPLLLEPLERMEWITGT